jgi:membrane protein
VSFAEDECPFLAGAIAYQIFFALIPLLALLIGVVGFLVGPEAAEEELGRLIRLAYPAVSARELGAVRQLVEGRALSLGLGAVGTLLGATAVYGALDRALGEVLGGTRRRFLGGAAGALGFTLALISLFALSFVASYGVQLAQDLADALGFAPGRGLLLAAGQLAGLVAGFLLFFLIYRSVPRVAIPAAAPVQAAVVSALLWETAKFAFASFTRALGVFEAYGALAFAAGLLTWMYLTAAIILVGAEVIKTRKVGDR